MMNHRGWMFPGVHNAYTVALAAFQSCQPSRASTEDGGASTGSTAGTPLRSSLDGGPRALNHGGVFDEEPVVAVYPGPARSLAEFREIVSNGPEQVPVAEFLSWSSTAAFPQVPNRAAFKVWRKMKRHPRFLATDTPPPPEGLGVPTDGGVALHERPPTVPERRWAFRPIREFDSTNDRHRFLNDDGAAAGGIR